MKRHNKKYAKRMTKHYKKQYSQIALILTFIMAIGVIGHESLKAPYQAELTPKTALTGHLPENKDKKVLTIQDKIAIAATKAGINVNTALAIAQCESGQNPAAKNKQGSSATGLYQFIMATWWNNCDGDVMNIDDNISCFMKLYPNHPNWWECHKILARK